jgi:branched-chain amino acid transport system substrate-binding protein
LTQRRASPGFIRVSATSSQATHVMADYAAKEMTLKRVATIADDFAFGHEQVAGFQRVFEDNGGKVVKKLWPPLQTADYTPYLAQLSNIDGLFSGVAGANPLKLMKNFADLGLKGKIALIGGQTLDDDSLLKSLGEEGAGVVSAVPYASSFDSPMNRRFVQAMRENYDNLPGVNSMAGYVNGMVVEQALQKTGGRADDRKAMMAALHAVSFTDSPRGAFHLDHLGNVVGDIFIIRADRKDGKMVNTIIKTYENVGQFWTFDEKWFLEQPVYSRDYPPAKNLEP